MIQPDGQTNQPFATPAAADNWAFGLLQPFPGGEASTLPVALSLPWSGDPGLSGALVQDPSVAALGSKSLDGATVYGAGASDPITGTVSLEGPTVVGGSLRAVVGLTSAPPTAIRYQWQRSASVGDAFTIAIPASEAYGDEQEALFIEYPKSTFIEEGELDEELFQEGEIIPLESPEGDIIEGVVCEVKLNSIVLDFNHPLAGEDLLFEGEVVGVE
jgi:hypothetical protein